ncbi:MAG: hypothetical protein J5821_03975 [Alphaproteobacteria bacterium]|nr:hypothetical protein [Alphaproteobacteria bacterium]
MYINKKEIEEERFSIEDVIVPYSNIEITHVNDNKPPFKVMLKKAVVWLLIIGMVAGLFFF